MTDVFVVSLRNYSYISVQQYAASTCLLDISIDGNVVVESGGVSTQVIAHLCRGLTNIIQIIIDGTNAGIQVFTLLTIDGGQYIPCIAFTVGYVSELPIVIAGIENAVDVVEVFCWRAV